MRETWSSSTVFILVAVSTAVGLGNVWRFPYIVAENGGAAFLLIYLVCVLLIGMPLMMGEILIGIRGKSNVSESIRVIAREDDIDHRWGRLGGLGMTLLFIVNSFYVVIAGWVLVYTVKIGIGVIDVRNLAYSGKIFSDFLADPTQVFAGQVGIILICIVFTLLGIKEGLENLAKSFLPVLLLSLLLMIFAGITYGDMDSALRFLLVPDFSSVSTQTVGAAVGQAMFSLSVGAGLLAGLSAYLPSGLSVVNASVIVILCDLGVAMLAGLAVFPFVVSGSELGVSGPEVAFVGLLGALGEIPFAKVLAFLFFFGLLITCLTTIVSAVEVLVNWVKDVLSISKRRAMILFYLSTFLLGVPSVLSFNLWNDVYPLAFIPGLTAANSYELIDSAAVYVGMPISVLFFSLFLGWYMSKDHILDELIPPNFKELWSFIIRYLTPSFIVVMLVLSILS